MQLLADVNVSRRVVLRLRSLGLDVVRVSDILDCRASDRDILVEARRLGAVILSCDQDFGALLAVSGATGPSLINLRVSRVDVEELAHTIMAVLRVTEAELRSGAIVTLDDAGLRVHRLPLG